MKAIFAEHDSLGQLAAASELPRLKTPFIAESGPEQVPGVGNAVDFAQTAEPVGNNKTPVETIEAGSGSYTEGRDTVRLESDDAEPCPTDALR